MVSARPSELFDWQVWYLDIYQFYVYVPYPHTLSFMSWVLQSLQIPAIWLHHHPLREVDSVHLQILLKGTCRQCGSWSVTGHNHRKVIGRERINTDDNLTWQPTGRTMRSRNMTDMFVPYNWDVFIFKENTRMFLSSEKPAMSFSYVS